MTEQHQGFPIPPKFWQSLSETEWGQLFQMGVLPQYLAARLWHMQDRQGVPSGDIEILLNKKDVDQMIRQLKTG